MASALEAGSHPYVTRLPFPGTARDLPTVCVLCSHNCGLRVDVEDDRIVEVRADESNPVSRGYSCNKAYAIPKYVDHAQRVEHPLKRRPDGTFERVTWEQAIAEIGARLRSIVDEHSPEAFAFAGGGGQGNHLDVVYATAFREALGSPWWFNALGQEKTQHALVEKWMFESPCHAWMHADIERSDYVILLGTNPLLSNRGRNAGEYVKALKGSTARTLVVVDPRRTETAAAAHVHLAVTPGSDVFLLLALCAHIVQTGRVDESFLRHHAEGEEPLFERLRAVNVPDMAKRCGESLEKIIRVAEDFAAAKSACVYMDLGVEHGLFSTFTAYLMRVLGALTGNIGNPGGQVFESWSLPAIPLPKQAPFKSKLSGIESIEIGAPFGMFSPNLMAEEILADSPTRIRALVVEGANPVVQYADSSRGIEALSKLDLLVVIEPAMSETAQLAHYVLPAPVGYEKWEFASFPKGYPGVYAQVRPPVVRGPEDALPEAEIFARLARATGAIPKAPWLLHRLARKARTPAGAAAFFAATAALALAAGVRHGAKPRQLFARQTFWVYEALGPHLPGRALATQWLAAHLFALKRKADVIRAYPELSSRKNPFAIGEFLFARMLEHPEGMLLGQLDELRNFEDHCLRQGGKMNLAPEPMLGEFARAAAFRLDDDPRFPLILNAGRRTHWNANTVMRDPSWRKGKGPHCAVQLSEADATRLGIRNGAMVRVETARGAVELPAAVDRTLRAGNVTIPNGFGLSYPDPVTGELVRTGVSVNDLTDGASRDPFTGCPHHKYVRCRVVALDAEKSVAAGAPAA
jgi:anaerobic selenocysteine-containing dehydrogenase